MTDKTTIANKNRAIRKEALREQLSAGGHLQQAIENIEKINNAADALELQKAKAAFDARMKIVGKYLPDLKAVEHTGETDHQVTISWKS